MRRPKAVTAGLLLVAVLVTAGVGYSAFTASANINASATSVVPHLEWGPWAVNSSSQTANVCNGTATGPYYDTLDFFAENLGVGDSCLLIDTLQNVGPFPLTVSEEITEANSASACANFAYRDNFWPTKVPIVLGTLSPRSFTIPAYGYLSPGWAGTVEFDGGPQGESCAFQITLTGT